jgi:ribosomal protein S17E
VADNLFVQNATIENFVSSINFTTPVGNPTGPFDINKTFSLFSTSYTSVSSLTHNILNYNMNLQVQDQTSFNLNIAETNFGINYVMTPQNVGQWGSSILIFNDYQNPGDIDIVGNNLFTAANLTGTFDLQMQYAPSIPGYVQNFGIDQRYVGTTGQASTIFLAQNAPNPPLPVPLYYIRYEIGTDGYCRPTQSNPVPYETSNTNTFKIYQDINDVTIQTTDRLNLNAGEIFLNGAINLNDINVNNLNANNLVTNSTTTTYLSEFIQTNNTWGSGTTPPNMIQLDYNANIGSVSSLASTATQIMTNAQAGYINNYISQISTKVETLSHAVTCSMEKIAVQRLFHSKQSHLNCVVQSNGTN